MMVRARLGLGLCLVATMDLESMGRVKCRINTEVAQKFILGNQQTTKNMQIIQYASKFFCHLLISSRSNEQTNGCTSMQKLICRKRFIIRPKVLPVCKKIPQNKFDGF